MKNHDKLWTRIGRLEDAVKRQRKKIFTLSALCWKVRDQAKRVPATLKRQALLIDKLVQMKTGIIRWHKRRTRLDRQRKVYYIGLTSLHCRMNRMWKIMRAFRYLKGKRLMTFDDNNDYLKLRNLFKSRAFVKMRHLYRKTIRRS